MTDKYAVLGSPIQHSLSPKIHNLVFSRLSSSASYESFEVQDNLAQFLADKPDYAGFSLTMPLKDQAFEIATSLSPLAASTKSVNTLLRTKDGYKGFNTDVFGIQKAVNQNPQEVAVLGSGATARSALTAFGDSKKVVYARNQELAAELAEEFDATVVSLTEALHKELVISTFPKGVLPELVANSEPLQTVLDVAYTNPKIPAKRYISGLEMLIHQAIYQQRIFHFGGEETALRNEPELIEELFELLLVAK